MKSKNLCMFLCLVMTAGICLSPLSAAAAEQEDQSVEAALAEGFALDETVTDSGMLMLEPAEGENAGGEAGSYQADAYVYADYSYIDSMDQTYCYYYNHMSDRQQGVYAAFLHASQDPLDLTVFHFADKFGKGFYVINTRDKSEIYDLLMTYATAQNQQ